jgi:hypothetical protein
MATMERNRTNHLLARRAIAALVACSLLTAATAARADDVAVNASLNPLSVPLGNEAILTVTVQGKFRKSVTPALPEIQDLYIYESGTSQSFSFINGQVSSSITFT